MINIQIKKAKKANGFESMFIRFPYDKDLVGIVRGLSSRYWHKESKEWEAPISELNTLLSQTQNWDITITGNIQNEEIKNIPTNYQFKLKPYDYQLEGIKYGLNNDVFLRGDDMGLGKSKQVIDLAAIRNLSPDAYPHTLIVCGVNGLKWNWAKEIEKHSYEEAHILGMRTRRNGNQYDAGNKARMDDLENLPNRHFLITNIEALRNKNISSKLSQLCKDGIIGMIAVDEVHKIRNPSAQQTKGLLKLQAKYMVGLSGTLLVNNPLDLYVPLKWIGAINRNFYQYKNRYAVMGGYGGYEIVGYKNLSEIRSLLDKVMIRRLKGEVLDLPDKTHITEYVEMGRAQELIYKEVLETIRQNIDKIKLSPNPLAQLIRLRQATGYTGILSSDIMESAKLDRMEEIVEDLVANGEKVVIFSNWTDITTPAFNRLKKYNPAIITGDIKDRQAEELKFMKDDTCKVIIGTVGAMGTGLTLTAGTTAIFLDSPWNRALKEQAEDRIHRIGTKGNVTVITLVTKGTIDERIEDIVNEKGKMADLLVDGKLPEGRNREKMLEYFIS